MSIPLSPYAPETLITRDGFSRPVSRQPAHPPYCSDWFWCLLAGFLPISAAASIYLFKPPYAIGLVSILSGRATAYNVVQCQKSAGTGPVVLNVVAVVTGGAILKVAMDELMRGSLFLRPLLE